MFEMLSWQGPLSGECVHWEGVLDFCCVVSQVKIEMRTKVVEKTDDESFFFLTHWY